MAKHFTNCTTPILKTLLKTFMLSLLWPMYLAKLPQLRFKKKSLTLENKPVKQQKEDFKNVLENSHKKNHNGKKTPLYSHANHTWKKDKLCKGAFDTYQAYWKHMLVLLEKQEGLCKVAKIPMSLSSGPWKISCDAIDPLLGHVPDNLRLVCLYNNVADFSKLNKDLTDTRPTSPTTDIHDEYWRIVRDKEKKMWAAGPRLRQ